ncbi:MAG TPA: hypothetical protein VG992_02300 [Candidatus Saccharimonadales bacterium]|nr:hypothetical protein [Candidatus Saccharimonadales bacterium]
MAGQFECSYPICGFEPTHGEPTTGDCEQLRDSFIDNTDYIGALEVNPCPMAALKSLVVKSVAQFEGAQNA